MKDSIQIATAFGIPIRVHWTFLLIFVLFAQMSGSVWLILVLFLCVLLHELGHSLMARHFGVRVIDITFWPLGGMARMTHMPEEARVEGWIAVAGPLVNLFLAVLGFGVLSLGLLFENQALQQSALFFMVMNLFLGGFNLLPAFPMDGGRILRAWFARKRDWVDATERAVRVGRWVVVAMLVFSLANLFQGVSGSCTLPLIALFVWFAGGRELMAVRVKHGLPPFGNLGGPLSRAFGGAYTAAPREAEATWTQADPSTGPAEEEPPAGRPTAWGKADPQHGFDEEAVRRLERYRGRLRRFDDDQDA